MPQFKCNHNNNEYGILTGCYPLINKFGDKFWQFTTHNNSTGQSLEDCQPILKPLSDLIKRLPNGKIPIIELMNIAYGIEYSEIYCNYYIEEDTVICEVISSKLDLDDLIPNKNSMICEKIVVGFEVDIEPNFFGFDKYGKNLEDIITYESFQIVLNPDKIIQYLIANHFDIDGLIAKGLALNFNDIEGLPLF
jgi:hypothetical protein